MTQSDFSSKFLPIWLPLYRVESVLTNSNYIIRKVGTNFTQCVHRIRLRTVSPQYQVDDLSDINPDDFRRDPHLGRFRGEPQLFDETIPSLLDPPPQEMPGLSEEQDIPAVTVGLTFPLPMEPAPVIPVAPLPPVGGHVVPPDPIIPEGPVLLASSHVTPPDTSDDSSHEEAGPPQSDQHEVPPRPAPNEFILRQTQRAIRSKERSNQLNFGFLRSSPQLDAGGSSSTKCSYGNPEATLTTRLIYRLLFENTENNLTVLLWKTMFCTGYFSMIVEKSNINSIAYQNLYGGKLSTACIISALQVIWALSKR